MASFKRTLRSYKESASCSQFWMEQDGRTGHHLLRIRDLGEKWKHAMNFTLCSDCFYKTSMSTRKKNLWNSSFSKDAAMVVHAFNPGTQETEAKEY